MSAGESRSVSRNETGADKSNACKGKQAASGGLNWAFLEDIERLGGRGRASSGGRAENQAPPAPGARGATPTGCREPIVLPARTGRDALRHHLTYGPAVKPVVMV